MADNHWLNLTEAADLAKCSRKTLYRYMTRGVLEYRKEANNRRYVQRHAIETLFPIYRTQKTDGSQTKADCSMLTSSLEILSEEVATQSELLKRMIALYKPKTLGELVSKRKKSGEL